MPEKDCCKRAFLCGALDTCGEYFDRSFVLTSESEDITGCLLALVEDIYGVQMTLTGAVRDPKRGRDKLIFSYAGENAGEIIEDYQRYCPRNGIQECCKIEYMKGVFLGGGSCTLPKEGTKTGYHLEFSFDDPWDRDAEYFSFLLDDLQFIASIIERGTKRVVYLKSREAISDFLGIVGAESALKRLETVSSEREERNNENRRSNCFAGNADKTMTASAEQVLAFGKLKEAGKFAQLSQPLKETAQARLDNPELSLSELAETLGLSKSCVAHRLRKLLEIYKRGI